MAQKHIRISRKRLLAKAKPIAATCGSHRRQTSKVFQTLHRCSKTLQTARPVTHTDTLSTSPKLATLLLVSQLVTPSKTSKRQSLVRPTSTHRCTQASPRLPAMKVFRKSPSGSRHLHAPRRVTLVVSLTGSRASLKQFIAVRSEWLCAPTHSHSMQVFRC